MILTKKVILEEIRKGRIKITPFDKTAVGAASVDLTLGDTVRVFKKTDNIPITEGIDYKKYTRKISIKKGYILEPGELILGITKERIKLPDDICGWLQSRSRFARLGLIVHMTAPFMQPGIDNHQALEIFNAGPHDLKLKPGIRVCQFIFERCEGKARYRGKFSKQSGKTF
ncbi:dCTP deaminase [Candidatus Woesearchaeota archaeon]|nr:dCTP deaminase [Candidatus Woesearchaeota archaeon]